MPLPVLLLELGLIAIGLSILARLANGVGFSPIPLYFLAGLAFGDGGLIPVVTAESFIEIGAQIGVILLLLMLGVEYSAEELATNLRAAAPLGLLNLALNFTPGVAAGLILGWEPLAAVLLGGITYVTSSSVMSKLLEDLEWIGNRETPVVLSVAVMEDLTMALYLPVIAVLLQGSGLLGGAVAALAAVGAVVVVLLLAIRFGGTISQLVFSHSDEAVLLGIFGIALVVAGAAERLHVSAAAAAFLVGIALSGPAADRARELLAPVRDLFAAVFFIFFGFRIAPASIPPVLLTALLLALVTAATKMATGYWGARRAGVGTRGRFRAGAMLVARGEFSIAIAGVGVSAGVEPQLGALAAGYVLILAVLGPILARVIDPLVVAIRARQARIGPERPVP